MFCNIRQLPKGGVGVRFFIEGCEVHIEDYEVHCQLAEFYPQKEFRISRINHSEHAKNDSNELRVAALQKTALLQTNHCS
jgi:hypothetical protein